MKLPIPALLVTALGLLALACGPESSTVAPLPSTPALTTAGAPATPARRAASAPAPTLAAESDAPDDEACVEVDDERGGRHVVLEGRVLIDETYEHPTRGKTRPYVLRLDAPRCARGTEEARIVELQLAASDGISLKPLVGRRVRVAGDPFAAHTAWHARPVVLMTTSAKPLS